MNKILILTLLLAFLCYHVYTQPLCENFGLVTDGGEGFITTTSWYLRNQFTIELWMRITNTSKVVQAIVSGALNIYGPSSCYINGYLLSKVNNTVFFAMGGTNICEALSLNSTIVVGEWTHIAVTVDTSAALYINSALVVTRPVVGSIDYGNSTAPFRVGVGTDLNSNLEDSSLDEIRFWNYALSSSEISSNYLISLSRPTPLSLLAYWRFNEPSAIIIDDSIYNRSVEAIGVLYTSNCVVAQCLCDLDEHCIPDVDRLDCPTSTISSTTSTTDMTTTSSTTEMTSSTEMTTTTDNSTSTQSTTHTKTSSSTILSCVVVMLMLALLI